MEIKPLAEYEPPVTAEIADDNELTTTELAALRATRDQSVVRSGGQWFVSDEEMDGERADAFRTLYYNDLVSVADAQSEGGHRVEVTMRGLQFLGVNDHRDAEL
ncbi:hypothetical protein AB5J62_26370 [Amycolatopsis sp. cg5]|uniref:hypothetical protein n=1 Tax=Amycolatopsis sp. cg5 TaxID=3238802 RepID=UPI0035262103